MSGNSSRYRFTKECKIHIRNFQVDKRFFTRIYLMSHKWRNLNLIVLKMHEYMKFDINYVYIGVIKITKSLITN